MQKLAPEKRKGMDQNIQKDPHIYKLLDKYLEASGDKNWYVPQYVLFLFGVRRP